MKETICILLFALLGFNVAKSAQREYTDPTSNVIYTYDTNGSTAQVKTGDYSAPGSPNAKGDITILSEIEVDGKTYEVTKIGTRAFRNCYELTSVHIPRTIKEIGDWAFTSCASLTTINFPDGITKIEYGCFWYCSSLHSVELPTSLTSIEGNAFVNCGLKSVDIPENVKTIGGSAFAENELEAVSLPEGLVSIGPGAFAFNYSLGNVAFPSSLQEIGDGAFSNCKNITSITLPAKLSYIGLQAFHDIPGLKTVISLIEDPFDIEDVFLISGRLDIGFFINTEATLYVPAGTKNKYKNAKGWNLFHPILEPGSIAKEYEDPETGVVYLYETDWPQAMVKRGTKSGAGSPNATGAINIAEAITVDGDKNYQVTEIGTFAFFGNDQLMSVTIPSSVTSIGEGAFSMCNNLTTVILPPSITKIESGLFYGCSKLNEVTLPDALDMIWWCAFKDCTSLKEIKLPEGLTVIALEAFNGCIALKSFVVPKSVTTIGTEVLTGCTALETFIVEDGNPIYDSRDNCNGLVLTKANELIWGYKRTTIPPSVTSIGDMAFEFSDLTSIVIPSHIDSIKYRAYYGSENVTTIELPESQPWILIEAFQKLPNLKSIISKSPNPCNIEEVFDHNVYENVTVYIPKGLRNVYESHEEWGKFLHIVEVDDINNIQKFKRKVVVEEGTGTWCPWCPRGIVGIRENQEKYPDTFIPIAVHCNDAMQAESYNSLINQKLVYFPICIMNRKNTFDPNNEDLEHYYNLAINSETTSQITMSAKWMNETKSEVEICTTTNFAYDTTDDYRIAYVITENHVGPYTQENAYSGGDEGEMGGFENLPSSAYIYHDHVARYISRVNGTHRTVPETPYGQTDYKYSYPLEIPNSVQIIDNIELIVLLINQETMEIENADRITANQIGAYDPAGIHNFDMQVKQNGKHPLKYTL